MKYFYAAFIIIIIISLPGCGGDSMTPAEKFGKTALAELPADYSPGQARENGDYIFVEGEIPNTEVLDEFIKKIMSGKKAFLRRLSSYKYGVGVVLEDIYYDGKKIYITYDSTRWASGGEVTYSEYKYLKVIKYEIYDYTFLTNVDSDNMYDILKDGEGIFLKQVLREDSYYYISSSDKYVVRREYPGGVYSARITLPEKNKRLYDLNKVIYDDGKCRIYISNILYDYIPYSNVKPEHEDREMGYILFLKLEGYAELGYAELVTINTRDFSDEYYVPPEGTELFKITARGASGASFEGIVCSKPLNIFEGYVECYLFPPEAYLDKSNGIEAQSEWIITISGLCRNIWTKK